MSSSSQVDDRAIQEAWRWLAVMSETTVSTAAVQDFFVWRSKPGHAEAYERASVIRKASGGAANSPVVHQILAEIDASGPLRKQRTSSVSPVALGLGAAGVCGAALAIAIFMPQLTGDRQTFKTAVGESRAVVLSDGTHVNLDTATTVRVHYSATVREVTLIRGQALFDVVHVASRPFLVNADRSQVRDLGTRFDVRRDAGSVRVTLLAGSAEVTTNGAAAKTWTLAPGQQISTGAAIIPPHAVDAFASASWTDGHLMFDNTPLSSAIEEVNRYGQNRVVLGNPRLASLSVSGTFNTADTDAFVTGVSKLHNLKADHRDDGAIVLLPLDPPNPT